MTNFFIYLLQISGIFTSLVILYYFLFRNLTFHGFNRTVLLALIPLALLIPLADLPINIEPFTGQLGALHPEARIIEGKNLHQQDVHQNTTPYLFYIAAIYWIGAGIGFCYLVMAVFKIAHIKQLAKKSELYDNVFYTANTQTAFSFFKWVFIPRDTKQNHQAIIIKHELAHLKYLHKIDLFITELFTVFTWFNPFNILYKKLLKSAHEYQADAYVTQGHATKSDYLSVLLENLSSTSGNYITSNFNHLSIKNRIFMMTKIKSPRIQSLRYLLLLPLIAVFLVAFTTATGTEPSIFPIAKGLYEKISSPYGVTRKDPFSEKKQVHRGIDIVAPLGTAVLATGNGKVTKAQEEGAYGNLIIIDHGNQVQSLYAHLEKINVEEGDQVNLGDAIGTLGNTGKSKGPHLHYEVRKNGKVVDPNDYFKE